MAEPIYLSPDPEIRELVPSYLNNRKNDIETITALLQSGDYGAIVDLGHKMKGSGGLFGIKEIGRAGTIIERAALERDFAILEATVRELKDYLSRVELVME